MAFHDVRLPTKFSAGSLFGPGFATKILELDSMADHRIQRGPVAGRRTYSLERGIDSLTALYELYEFFVARGGALNSFRLKDWLDYATTQTGTTYQPDDAAVAHDDEDLVLVSGLTYQFVKRYTSGSQVVVRTLTKLVSGTVKVGDSTGELVSGFTLDLLNGRVTFSSAPTGQVTGGCEFDVPARFAEETDQSFLVGIEAVTTGNLPEIRCIEDVEPVVASQDYPLGGATDHGDPATDIAISDLSGRLHRFAPTTAGKAGVLPPLSGLAAGGPYFCIVNAGSQSLDIDEDAADGGSTLKALAAGSVAQAWIGVTAAGAKEWHVF